jgi:hypothetical protein
MSTQLHLPLKTVPDHAESMGVTCATCHIAGRDALCLVLSDERRRGVLGRDFGDEPTFLLLPVSMMDGTIEVDVLARLLPDAPDYARGFIGLAYRVQGDGTCFESIYVRPMNGRGMAPPPPRHLRAVQYFAYPEWKFDRLRADEPDGGYEAAADVAPNTWISLRLDISGNRVCASIDGVQTLVISPTKLPPQDGRIGLWVDIGTEGYFSNLRVTPSAHSSA